MLPDLQPAGTLRDIGRDGLRRRGQRAHAVPLAPCAEFPPVALIAPERVLCLGCPDVLARLFERGGRNYVRPRARPGRSDPRRASCRTLQFRELALRRVLLVARAVGRDHSVTGPAEFWIALQASASCVQSTGNDAASKSASVARLKLSVRPNPWPDAKFQARRGCALARGILRRRLDAGCGRVNQRLDFRRAGSTVIAAYGTSWDKDTRRRKLAELEVAA